MPTLIVNMKFNPAEITIFTRATLKDSSLAQLNSVIPRLTTSELPGQPELPRFVESPMSVSSADSLGRHFTTYTLVHPTHYCDLTARAFMFMKIMEVLESEDEGWKLRASNSVNDPETDKEYTMYIFSRDM